ncbi:EAL domain-containing protein [Photobacterium sagamiensis]|uniref:bifunctional diguanylate cyclase/phosphodiesterase n=1 Tax=Photobacterium sagamiensis TaxID=2910241 RepID=UPI003D0ED8BC
MHLKPKIALSIFPVILLQIVVLLIPSFMIYQDYFGEQIKGHIRDSIVQVQNALDSQLTAIEADSSIFSQSVILNRYLRTEDETIRFNVMHQVLLKEFSTFMNAHPEYIEISLIMPDGYEEVSLVNNHITNVTDEEQDTSYFKNIAESKSNFEINTFMNPDTDEWTLVSARKIFQKNAIEQSGSTKKVIKGYLIVKTNFDFLNYLLTNNSLVATGFVIIHDTKGTPILMNVFDELIFDDRLKVVNETVYSNKIKISNWSLNGESYIVGQKQLINSLFFSIGWPESELNQLFKNVSYASIQNSLIVILLSVLVLFWILNKLLVKPILQLSLSAKNMGQGDSLWSFKSKADDELTDLANTIKDMGQGLIKQKQKVHEIAYQDSLTQLPNRRQFIDELNRQYCTTHAEPPNIALLFIDLDGFKQVNDTCGHEAGDQVLIAVAERLKHVLRADDTISYAADGSGSIQHTIARLGGDEFTILLKKISDRDAAGRVAERILHAFSKTINVTGREFLIGVSIGISLADESGESAVELLKNSDTAMYDAKMQGKNTYRFFSRTVALKSLKALEIKEDLRRAINNNELKLAYQPQICTKTRKIVGCEALVRWNHPVKGWIRPDVFIPIAEESGLIISLGRWVLLEACHQIRQWQLMGYPAVRVSVNVSCVQLARDNMHQVVLDCLAETGLSADLLAVEVTESSILQGSDSIVQLEKIQSEGIRIALDDFGTGYSSLSALRGLPINELKIDKSFITDLTNGEDGKAIVSAIIAMAHQLDLQVVAEGVETNEELDFLEQTRADIIQGYYFSKPLMGNGLAEFLSSHSDNQRKTIRKPKLFALKSKAL